MKLGCALAPKLGCHGPAGMDRPRAAMGRWGHIVRREGEDGSIMSTRKIFTRVNSAQRDETLTRAADEVAERELEQKLEKMDEISNDLKQLALWVGGATAFGAGVWGFLGPQSGQEFFAGYLLEQSLSVDNLFVFILVFGFFKTPPDAQKKVLSWGIYSAAVLRLAMILAGTTLIEKFRPLLLVFAGILIFSAYGLLTGDDDEDENLAENPVYKFCKSVIKCSDDYDGDKFVTTAKDGVRMFTPLMLVLAVIEISDVIFAVDSIPAVFGVTLDPFIIYTSNIFAILSLRSLYGFVADVMEDLHYLNKAIAVILGFIGSKLALEFVGVEVPTDISLAVVAVLLAGGVALSYALPPEKEA